MFRRDEHDSYGEIISTTKSNDLDGLKDEALAILDSAMDDGLIDVLPVAWYEIRPAVWMLEFDCGCYVITEES